MPMVRKARCPMCGSAKATPTTSAFIYCDYCGQLMDLDIERYRQEVPIPSEEYQTLDHNLAPQMEGARARRDRAELTELYRIQQDRWLTDMAAIYTPRIKDPEFRARYVDYLAYTRMVADLSPRVVEVTEALSEANAGMEMVQRDGRWLITGKSLWPIIEAQQHASEVYREAVLEFEDPVADPDDTPPAVSNQLGIWLYVSGFMTMIDDATAAELLRRTGLEAGWEQVPEPELHQVFCGHCGTRQARAAGARRVLCESCGKHADVGTAAHCHSCGSAVVIGLGRTQATCEHCQAEVRLVPQLS